MQNDYSSYTNSTKINVISVCSAFLHPGRKIQPEVLFSVKF